MMGAALALAVFVLAVVGPATGLVAHLPTRVLRCHRPRARAPVFSSQVDEASASAAEIDEEWFPAGARPAWKTGAQRILPSARPAGARSSSGRPPASANWQM